MKKKKRKEIKTYTKKKKTLSQLGVFLLCTLIYLGLVVGCYFTLGKKLTIVAAFALLCLGVLIYIFTRKGKKRKKLLNLLLIFILTTGIIVLLAFSAFIIYIRKQAEPKYKVELLNTREVSIIYANDGREIAKLGAEKREKVSYDELPEVLIDAIIATEDSRFFQHNGLDAPRFLMATINQFLGKAGAGGASTLSMQVIKNSFTSKEASGIEGIIRKFEDIYLAVFKLEKDYSKEQIIEFYVNNHFLGENIYGVEEASRAYFGKSVTELNLSEAAILAGMFKSPNAYRPTVYPENAAARRRTVLYLMRRAGYITAEEEKIANSIPVESLAVKSNATANPYQGFIDMVAQELEDKYGVNPYKTSLQVYTTLDVGKQNAVNSVLNGETYTWINDVVQAGVAVLNSEDGAILAIGNGRNIGNRSNSSQRILNYATQIKRQPGSTAKPLFDYGPGIEFNDWSTYKIFVDEPYSYTGGQAIHNWDGKYNGTMTLRTALATSRNIPALKAFKELDKSKVRDFVLNLGITPEICNSGYTYNKEQAKCVNKKDATDMLEPNTLHEAHSIGAFSGVSPLVLAGAYQAFSNGGYYNEPYSVTKFVYRQSGEIVEHQLNKTQVMSEATAYMITNILQGVGVNQNRQYYTNLDNIARKTGTTNYDDKTMSDYKMPWDATRDSWIVGYSTKTVISLWYGYDTFTKESVAQDYVLHNVPATLQKDYIFTQLVKSGAMEANRPAFTQPSSVSKVGIAVGSNPPKLAPPGTDTIYEYFKKGTEPTEYDLTNYKMPAPTILSHEVKNNKISLSWKAVDPGQFGNSSHGKFGYNIYKDNVLIAWTDKTSYTYTPNGSVYGTYKIIGTYKSYNDIQTEPSTVKVEPEPEPEPEPEEPKEEEPKEQQKPNQNQNNKP